MDHLLQFRELPMRQRVEMMERPGLNDAFHVEPLSCREKEMLQSLFNGISNREIAGRLFVSENTVKFHLKNIYSKLGVGNRLQAINAARALRLID
ncbi:helix-turn-helix transcriptional regulator [Methylibium sp.]|uniref:helix-turn-helix domain-containing protein n=1 Tax=Methylibium sp. TaxID=2067992 RepID=UPI003341BED8